MADDAVQFNLAVSLHSAIQETRQRIMPFAEKFPARQANRSIGVLAQTNGTKNNP